MAPSNPDYWLALGNAYFRARKYSDAAAAYKRAVECGGGTKAQQLYQQMLQYLQQKDYRDYQNKLRDSE